VKFSKCKVGKNEKKIYIKKREVIGMVKGFRKVLAITVAAAMLLTTGIVGMAVTADEIVPAANSGLIMWEDFVRSDLDAGFQAWYDALPRGGEVTQPVLRVWLDDVMGQWNWVTGATTHNASSLDGQALWLSGWLDEFFARNAGDPTFTQWTQEQQLDWLAGFGEGAPGWVNNAFWGYTNAQWHPGFDWHGGTVWPGAWLETRTNWVNNVWPTLMNGGSAPVHLFAPLRNAMAPWGSAGLMQEESHDWFHMFFPGMLALQEEDLWLEASSGFVPTGLGAHIGTGPAWVNVVDNGPLHLMTWLAEHNAQAKRFDFFNTNHGNTANWWDVWMTNPDGIDWLTFRNAFHGAVIASGAGSAVNSPLIWEWLEEYGAYLLDKYYPIIETNPLVLSNDPADYAELMAEFDRVWNIAVGGLAPTVVDLITAFETGWYAALANGGEIPEREVLLAAWREASFVDGMALGSFPVMVEGRQIGPLVTGNQTGGGAWGNWTIAPTFRDTQLVYGELVTSEASVSVENLTLGADNVPTREFEVIGLDYQEVWFSVVMRVDGAVPHHGQHAMLSFRHGDPWRSGTILNVGIPGIEWMGNAPRTGEQANWWVRANWDNVDNPFTATMLNQGQFSNVPIVPGEEVLIVVHMDLTADGTDTITFYFNPEIGGNEPVAASGSYMVFDDFTWGSKFSIEALSISSNSPNFLFGDIRFGDTFASVTPIPQPCECDVVCDICGDCVVCDCPCEGDCDLGDCGNCAVCGDCDCVEPFEAEVVVENDIITGLYFEPTIMDGDATIIVAVFEDDVMVDVLATRTPVAVAEVGPADAYRFIDLASANISVAGVTVGQEVRVFVWNGFVSMMPMTANLLTWTR